MMMFISNIFGIIVICIITRKTFSFENNEEEPMNDIILNPYLIKPQPVFINQYPQMDNPINKKISSFLNQRRSESAEKYFDWTRKTQRPVEFLRGRRFWLFAKKDDNDVKVDLIPNMKDQQNSLTQGLWRSGIVGRRR